ncbi:MAG: SpoIID/LytB domain-containing protein [Acidimicrobiia bacterium]
MTQRKSLILAALTALLVVPLGAAPAAAAEDPVWILEGAGWGHGVGMSQYGAYGMALEGATSAEIIDHFYSGAFIDDLPNRSLPTWWSAPYPLTVGLEQDVTSVTVKAINGAIELCQYSGETGCSPRVIPANDTVTISGDGAACTVSGAATTSGSCEIAVSWDQDGSTRVKVGATEYAHGTLRLEGDGNGELNVVLDIELERYLRGIAEMPGSWSPAALEAQAIAARNYAVRRVLDTSNSSGDPTRACGCHLYDTIFDQVYAGWSKEGISPNPWLNAVEATAGDVAVHPSTDRVFSAYYSSSSGGATEDNESVWGGTPLQFLRSVGDPWSISDAVKNPYADWEVSLTSSRIASILGWDSVSGVTLIKEPPGATIRFEGVDGGNAVTTDMRGDELRTTFDLRSPRVEAVIAPYDFRDVGSSVHRDAITYISDLGITKGCNPPGNDRFCPEELVTRGQMAAFLVRALTLPQGEPSGFSDMGRSVFASDVDRLVGAGITRGCNPPANDRYCPDRTVTRGQMAAFLVRAFGYSEVGDVDFEDDDGSEFEADIARLATAGVTLGCNPPDNDLFCPDQPMTRAEMATFLMRALQRSG